MSVSALEFFRKHGLVLKTEFLAASHCRTLCAQMRKARSQPAEVYGDAEVDPSARHARDVSVATAIADDLVEALAGLKTELADRFAIPLAPCGNPSFLRYGPGGCHRPHRDRTFGHAVSAGEAGARRVSISLLLNDDYAGGALTFYGLVDEPAWRDYGFALPTIPGLLVAFRSEIWHEVTPVLSGERYSVVTWYPEDAARGASARRF